MWYCTECGGPARDSPSGERERDGSFTSIDVRERYNLGYCDCTPARRVAVVKDPQVAADLATGVQARGIVGD